LLHNLGADCLHIENVEPRTSPLERRVIMAEELSIRQGLLSDRIRVVDESLECLRRCDQLITAAEGDTPLQAFWQEVKCEYQADVPRQTESATRTRTRLIALGKGPDIPLGPSPVIVGRDPWCDAQLNSIRVSRFHCCLTENDGKVVVLDLGSLNGTRINGRPVELAWLGPGDELSIAHLRYHVANNRANRRTSPPPCLGRTPC
jgi:hypothetical protein